MHFPKHWQLARRGGVCAWGWSDESPESARQEGERRVDRIIGWLKTNRNGPRDRYGYPDRPMREEVLREFRDRAGQVVAAVSRNSYGCQVLNTTSALFVDVDEPPKGLLAGITGLFRTNRFEPTLVAKVNDWNASNPSWGWRMYRTRAGIRLLATHRPIRPEDGASAGAFKAFGADPLYQRLCSTQKCFRARLSPKPWRCGLPKPPARWPWRDPSAESEFRGWNRRYEQAAGQKATCRLLGHFGNPEIHPDHAELLAFHDAQTRAESDAELA